MLHPESTPNPTSNVQEQLLPKDGSVTQAEPSRCPPLPAFILDVKGDQGPFPVVRDLQGIGPEATTDTPLRTRNYLQ